MIKIEELSIDNIKEYDSIESKYETNKIYELKKIDRGLGGFVLEPKSVKTFYKKFTETTDDWVKFFDVKDWKIFVAYDNDIKVGGAVLSFMLDRVGGKKHAVLWDLRVIEDYKHQGIGQKLFDKIKEEAKNSKDTEIKIECQNTNYAAVNFYYKQGAELKCINEQAYADYKDEIQMIWYLEL